MSYASQTRVRIAFAFATRAALLAAIWWVLAEGSVEAPLLSAALVCAAAAASFAVHAPARVRWRPSRAPSLAVYFLRQSLAGGWDVARRALAPVPQVRPALLQFETSLPAGFPRVLFAWLVSLTPGTASVSLDRVMLVVHALDIKLPIESQLRELEARVAALYC